MLVEDKIADAVEDVTAAVGLVGLEGVGVVADDAVGTGVDEGVGQLALLGLGACVVLPTPVWGDDDDGLGMGATQVGHAAQEGGVGILAHAPHRGEGEEMLQGEAQGGKEEDGDPGGETAGHTHRRCAGRGGRGGRMVE